MLLVSLAAKATGDRCGPLHGLWRTEIRSYWTLQGKQAYWLAWSPDSVRHGHQPPGVIFGSYSYEMKPRSQLSLLFPPLYLYYCSAHRGKKKGRISIATIYWPHLLPPISITLVSTSECHHSSSLWLYPWSFPPFGIQLALFSSAWSSVLLATLILEVVSESQPVWFGMLVATLSLSSLWRERVAGTRGSPSHLFWLNGKRLHSSGYSVKPKLKWKWQAIWGLRCQVSFIWKTCIVDFWQPHSGFLPKASLRKPLNLQSVYFWIATGVFPGQFLCSVIGPLVIQVNASWVVNSSQGFWKYLPMLLAFFRYGAGEGKWWIKLRETQSSSSSLSLGLAWT